MSAWRMEVDEVSKLYDNRVMVSGKLLEGERPQQGDHYQAGPFTGVVSDATSLGDVLGFMGSPTVVYGSGSSLSTTVSFVSQKTDLLQVKPGTIASGGSGQGAPGGGVKSEQGGGGCFIATACYGPGNCAELDELRRFRDEVLLRRAFGHAIVAIYYTVSPAIAEWLKARPKTAAFVRRGILDIIVSGLRRKKRQMPKKQDAGEGK